MGFGRRRYHPSKSAKIDFAKKMEEIEEFCLTLLSGGNVIG